MGELLLMPTPNWFITRPIDIHKIDDTVALSAINSFIITNTKFDKYNFSIKDAHTKRILAIAFHPGFIDNQGTKLLATCSEDLEVKVWNIETRNVLNQHKLHQNTPTCIDWLQTQTVSKLSDPILISCDIKGNIFKWNVNTNDHHRYFPDNKSITQLKASSNSFLIAVGYKHGVIVILDVETDHMKILFKLKNHEDSINFLSWFPDPVDHNLNNKETKETEENLKSLFNTEKLSLILASSSEDKTIRLWCVDKGIQLKCFKAPGASASNSSNKQQSATKINFTPLCWPTSRYLISGSFKGDLYALDLSTGETESNAKWKIFNVLKSERGHKKIIYDISFYKDTIITLSLDRLINIWDLKTFKQDFSLTTLNGFVYSIASSPIDSNVIALSVGDGSIKTINQKHNEKVAKNFSNNIKSEVTQISWHPYKESLIAFGTKDGKVGIADTMQHNKPAVYLYTSYNQSIYTLLWCEPLLFQTDPVESEASLDPKQSLKTNYYLYSVSDGKIMQHNIHLQSSSLSNLNTDNVKSVNFYKELLKLTCNIKNIKIKKENDENQNKIQASSSSQSKLYEFDITEFNILKIDNSNEEYYICVGKFDGSIEFFHIKKLDKIVIKLCTFFNHQKLVTNSKWNRDIYSNQLDDIFLASGSNDFNVIVIDFKNLIKDLNQKLSEIDMTTEASYLDLKYFSKFKHKLTGHKERITSLSWSSLNPCLLASCSYDSTVQIWNACEGTPLINYRGHSDKLLCCMFSAIDPNIVYSGGEDYCLLKWRIDVPAPYKLPPEECTVLTGKKKKFVKKQQQKKNESLQDEPGKTDKTQSNSVELTKANENEENPSTNKNEVSESESTGVSLTDIQTSNKKSKQTSTSTKASNIQRELKSLFVLSSHGNKTQKSKLLDCISLFEILYEKESSIIETLNELKKNSSETLKKFNFKFDLYKFQFTKDQLNLSLFGNRLSAINMLKVEQSELKKIEYEKYWIFDIWMGNLVKLVNEACLENNLNDTLVLLYQLATNSNENSEAFLNSYTDQLLKKGGVESINKAVLLTLACFDVEKSIKIYLSNNLYTYALCLAQIRLPPNSTLFYDILEKYASYSTYNGDYETSIMCYIRMSDFESAFKILNRRNTKNDAELENLIKSLSDKLATLLPNQNF